MELASILIAVNVLGLTVWLLLKHRNAALILIVFGMLMALVAWLLDAPGARQDFGGFILFSLQEWAAGAFSSRLAGSGLMVMLLFGYLEYMKTLKADSAFVYVMLQPLSVLRNYPSLACIVLIPIGTLLSYALPSAAAVGLLLVATLYPVLRSIGMGKLSILSIIVACTLLDLGLNSPNTIRAAGLLGMEVVEYARYQLQVVLPLLLVIIIVYFFFLRRDARRQAASQPQAQKVSEEAVFDWDHEAPLYYALLPVLPLLLSVIFSASLPLVHERFYLSLNGAIIFSFLLAGLLDAVRTRSFKKSVSSMSVFWRGMGNGLTTIVVMIVAADIFAQGLMKLGVIDTLVSLAQSVQIGRTGITAMLSVLTMFSTIITGSSTATFAAYGQIVPDVAFQFGADPLQLMLAVQLLTGIARALTPISIVMIAVAESVDVPPFKLLRFHVVPVCLIAVLTLLILLVIPL
jgi:DcuC family C4-dicarboxylate transporter